MTVTRTSMPGVAGGSSSARPTLAVPTLAFVFTVLLIALAVRDLDQPGDAASYSPVAVRRFFPAVAKGCRVTLGVTLPFMLIIMI